MSTDRRHLAGTPKKGDVVGVKSAEPGTDPPTLPNHGERVEIRLHGHPFRYIVRAEPHPSGPRLTELTMVATNGKQVDYAAARSVPVRRLAHSAVGWVNRAGGLWAAPGDHAKTHTRPDTADNRFHELEALILAAIANGDPVRPTVAAAMNVSLRTLDRLIAKARAAGFLDDIDLPRRPQPQQRDTTDPEN